MKSLNTKQNRIVLKEKKLKRNNGLAKLIGIILGDGCLTNLPRTESLRIVCNAEQRAYINHIAMLMKNVFNKNPSVYKRKRENATNITLYECALSERLNLPCGNKINNRISIPEWIKKSKKYSIKCLKGLFETDGSFYEDKNNYTNVIEFKNHCKNLLYDTHQMLKSLDYHPQFGKNYIRLAKREEVFAFKQLISFREY